jgi:hypothetical protein
VSEEGSAPWTVAIRPSPRGAGEDSAFFWIGLRNDTAAARAFCRLGITYLFDVQNGDTVLESPPDYPVEGAAHPCTEDRGHLVLAGETHFVRVSVELPDEALPEPNLRFQVTAQEACVEREPCDHGAIIVLQR